MVAQLAHSVNEKTQSETAIANANLIASAPCLLEALENILPDAIANHFGGPDTLERIRAAMAAIAKAKGETP